MNQQSKKNDAVDDQIKKQEDELSILLARVMEKPLQPFTIQSNELKNRVDEVDKKIQRLCDIVGGIPESTSEVLRPIVKKSLIDNFKSYISNDEEPTPVSESIIKISDVQLAILTKLIEINKNRLDDEKFQQNLVLIINEISDDIGEKINKKNDFLVEKSNDNYNNIMKTFDAVKDASDKNIEQLSEAFMIMQKRVWQLTLISGGTLGFLFVLAFVFFVKVN